MKRSNKSLVRLLERIKQSNDEQGLVMAGDATNERITNILADFNLEDDESVIEDAFGVNGLHKIREAEKGIY